MRKTKQICCLVLSTIIFGYMSSALHCLVVIAFLVCNFYQCCFGVQVTFPKHLAPIERVTDSRRTPTFSGGVSAATSSLPYNSTLGEAPQRGGKPPKHAINNSAVITKADAEQCATHCLRRRHPPVDAEHTASICRLLRQSDAPPQQTDATSRDFKFLINSNVHSLATSVQGLGSIR